MQGEGQANYRREIANGIVDQIKSLQAVGMNINDVNNVVLFNQYLDVMRSLSESNNTKTVVLPPRPAVIRISTSRSPRPCSPLPRRSNHPVCESPSIDSEVPPSEGLHYRYA